MDKKKKIKNKKTKRKHDREKIERGGEKKSKIQCIFPNGFSHAVYVILHQNLLSTNISRY